MVGKKYTDDVMQERAAAQGFTITAIDRSNPIPFVHMQCDKGHKRSVAATGITSVRCVFCESKRLDKETALTLISSLGYRLVGDIVLQEDRYGNLFVPSAGRMDLVCSNNHPYRTNITALRAGSTCPGCKGTLANAGYSRSEEIIAGVLDHVNIPFTRQECIVHEGVKHYIDFYLPQHNLFIEYDGSHHTYGRSDGSDEDLKAIQEKDGAADNYAAQQGILMKRIPHTYEGRHIVQVLADLFPTRVAVDDPVYDEIVRAVYNYSAHRFGWMTYEEIKVNADAYLNNSIRDASSITGVSQSVIARHFRRIYGSSKENYFKKLRGGEVG